MPPLSLIKLRTAHNPAACVKANQTKTGNDRGLIIIKVAMGNMEKLA